MFSKSPVDLDPLDLEVVERALEGVLTAIKKNGVFDELESDRDLEAALREELIEIVRSSGLTDAEALRDATPALAGDVVDEA